MLRSWRLATIMLTALSMGTAFWHLLEMPAKIWEYSHAVRAVLQIVALAALAYSVVLETPAEAR